MPDARPDPMPLLSATHPPKRLAKRVHVECVWAPSPRVDLGTHRLHGWLLHPTLRQRGWGKALQLGFEEAGTMAGFLRCPHTPHRHARLSPHKPGLEQEPAVMTAHKGVAAVALSDPHRQGVPLLKPWRCGSVDTSTPIT